MSLGVRFYLFAEEGLQRILQRLMEGLAHGRDAMPQFAGTRQKVANVLVEIEEGKPVRIARADGSFLTFDENGEVHKDLIASGFAAMETYRALERAGRNPETGTVVDLSPKLNREKWSGRTGGRFRRKILTRSRMTFGRESGPTRPRYSVQRGLLLSRRR